MSRKETMGWDFQVKTRTLRLKIQRWGGEYGGGTNTEEVMPSRVAREAVESCGRRGHVPGAALWSEGWR